MDTERLHPAVRELLAAIAQSCPKAGINRTVFGLQCMNDGNFIPRLEYGRVPTLKTMDRVRTFITGNTKAVKPLRRQAK